MPTESDFLVHPGGPEGDVEPLALIRPVERDGETWYAVMDEAGVPLALAQTYDIAMIVARFLGCRPVNVH